MNLQIWATILLTKLLAGKAQFPSGPEIFPPFQNTMFHQFDHYYPSISKLKYPQFITFNQQMKQPQYFEDNYADPSMNILTPQQQYNPYLPKLEPVMDTNRPTGVNQNPSNNHYLEYDKPEPNKGDIWDDQKMEYQPKVNRKEPFKKLPVPYESLKKPAFKSAPNTPITVNNGMSEVKIQPQGVIQSVTMSPPSFSAKDFAQNHLINLSPPQIESSSNNLPDRANLKKSKLIINNKEHGKNDEQKKFVDSPSLHTQITQNPIYHEKLKDSSQQNELVHHPEVLWEERYYYQPSNEIKKTSFQPLKENKIENVAIDLPAETSTIKSVTNVENSIQTSDTESFNSLFPNTIGKFNELIQPQKNMELSDFQSPQKDKIIDFKTLKYQTNTPNLDSNYNNKENKNQYFEFPTPYNNLKEEISDQYQKVLPPKENNMIEINNESETEPSINYSTLKIPVSTQSQFNRTNIGQLNIKQNDITDNKYNNSITKRNKNPYFELPTAYNNTTKEEIDDQYPKAQTPNANKTTESNIELETEPAINYSTLGVSTQTQFNQNNTYKLKIKQNGMDKLTNHRQTTNHTNHSSEYTPKSSIINYDTDILPSPFDDSLYYDDDYNNTTNNDHKKDVFPQKSSSLTNTQNKTMISTHFKNITNSTHLGNKQLIKNINKTNNKSEQSQILLSNKTDKVNIKQNILNILESHENESDIIPLSDLEVTTSSRILRLMTLQPIYVQPTTKNKARLTLSVIETTTYYDDNYINSANNRSKTQIIEQKLQIKNQNQDLLNSSILSKEISKNTNVGDRNSPFPIINESPSTILEKPLSTEINNFNISNTENNNIKNSINNLISQEVVDKTLLLSDSNITVNHMDNGDKKLKQKYLPPANEIKSNVDLNQNEFLPIYNNNTKVYNIDTTISNTINLEPITTQMSKTPIQTAYKKNPIIYTEDQSLNQLDTTLKSNVTLQYKSIVNQGNELNYYDEHSSESEAMWTEVGSEMNPLKFVE